MMEMCVISGLVIIPLLALGLVLRFPRLFLGLRLGAKEIEWKDWKFSRMMKLSGLQFMEKQLLKILRGLGNDGHWKQAIAVVEWVYHDKERRRWRSRSYLLICHYDLIVSVGGQ